MTEAAVPSAGTSPKAGQEIAGGKSMLLTRDLGWGAVFVFSLTSIGLTYGGLLPFSTIAGVIPGANLAGVFTVAAFFALFHAYVYSAIGALVRRNGADYLLASRVLNAPLAFASSWTLVIFMALAGGTVVASVLQEILPMFARALSLVFDQQGMVNNLEVFSSPAGVTLYGTIGVMLIFLMLIFSTKVTGRFLLVGLICSLAAWLLVITQMAQGSPLQFSAAWDQVMGQGSYISQLINARNQGLQMNTEPNRTALAGLVFGLTLFFGYFNATFFAREVKAPEKNLLRGSWSAVLVAWVLLAMGASFAQTVIPLEWLSAQSYLSRLAQFQESTYPWLPFYSMLLNPNAFVFWVVTAAWVLSLLGLAHTFLYTSSRIIQAWAEDNVVPAGVDFVHPVLRSPLIAVLIVSILAEVGVVLTALQERIGGQMNLSFILACVQVLPVLAITLLPFLRKQWFEQAPLMVRRKIGPIPLITICGLISLFSLGWAIASLFILPGTGAETLLALGFVSGVFLLGLAWFFGRKTYLAQQGQDLSKRFKELPKE